MVLEQDNTAGIYLHIPFCKQACAYCDFHFSTLNYQQSSIIEQMVLELNLRQSYLNGKVVKTIYFGGGTPSILPYTELEKLIKAIFGSYNCNEIIEITLEVNPDDISAENLNNWHSIGINRLSIGVQSWKDKDLKLMNRAHNRKTAMLAMDLIKNSKFSNYNIDLIYGLPGQSLEEWDWQLSETLQHKPKHISAYHLTIESKTQFAYLEKNKLLDLPTDELSASQFSLLKSILQKNGFRHYEISNFAIPSFESIHNTSYWQNKTYLGIGPSAHSYNGSSRQWNISNNSKYINAISNGVLPFSIENLSPLQLYNEWLLTQLRLDTGLDLEYGLKNFGFERINKLIHQVKKAHPTWFDFDLNRIRIKSDSLLLADGIIASLFETNKHDYD